MKKIEAVIKPHKIEDVRSALASLGILGLTAWEVRGFGRQKGHQELYRGSEYQVNFMPKVRLEIVITDDRVGDVVKAITESAQTGTIGDGKIFVLNVEQAVRIRTGEKDDEAL
ncbi:MAG TPA: P-II family nitrogen regulator [Candidatus Sumerlaeota bacterium]|nr:P-II family nitrogen regulator [Candidatus Sumerlaeota bacterium]HNM45536.1 P-II family nitrogen regulator [Candidatus Sumerlaeota bacterium]